jgi:branched-chain amino acid transport system substrate-binding protein
MKKLVLALAATTFMSTAALAEDIKIGVFLGFTGPIESTTPAMGRWR